MYLQQIRLKNIACFNDITFDFTQPTTGQPCRWVVLVGENGTGKSTILQMIALALLGRDMVRDVARGIEWGQFANAAKGRLELRLLATKNDKKRKHENGGYQYQTAFELGPHIRTGLRQPPEFAEFDYDRLEEMLYDSQNLSKGWFACGYGPWRTLSRSMSHTSGPGSHRKPYRFATMFSTEYVLTDFHEWLIELEFGVLKESERAKRARDLAIQTLQQVLPGLKFKEITAEREIIFDYDGVAVPINQLSDGYRSTMAWVGDLVRRLIDAFPNLKNPLQAEGIVLVDELDIHLHPKWQRSIVETVRQHFPKLQFIVSSHSPFVAQDMQAEDKIIVLSKQPDGMVTHQESTKSVQGWRVDQILTSYLFDLETTRDISIAVAEQEYQQLLDLQAQTTLSLKQKQRLKELKKWLRENKSSPGENVDEDELYSAAAALSDILDEYLAR